MTHFYDRTSYLTPLLGGQSGSRVWRLTELSGETKIVKITRREEMPDYLTANYPSVDMAEYHFYTKLQPLLNLPVPALHAHGLLPHGGVFVVLEDVAINHRLLPFEHHYTTEEVLSIVETYALLHGRGEKLLADEKSYPYLHPDPRTTFAPHLVLPYLQELAANEWTEALATRPLRSRHLPSLLREVISRLAHLPTTILHNDFYPTNIALPLDRTQPGLLLDWQLIGRGPLELDLANIGLQSDNPHFQAVDIDAVLFCYLEALARGSGYKIPLATLREQCTYAKLLLALDFLPRFVRAMHRSNTHHEPWIPWTREAYVANMTEIASHL